METTIESASPVLKSVRARYDATEVAGAFRAELRKFAQRAKIPGFRPGKAPEKVVESRYHADIFGRAVDGLVRKGYESILRSDDMKTAVNAADVRLEAASDQGVVFSFNVEFLPASHVLVTYEGLQLERVRQRLPEDFDNAVRDRLVGQHTVFEPVDDRAIVAAGDAIVASYVAAEGPAAGRIKGTSERIALTSTSLARGFVDGVVGAVVGEPHDVEIFPRAQDGTEAEEPTRLRVTVEQILRPEAPTFDDAFVARVTEQETVAAFLAAERAAAVARLDAAEQQRLERRAGEALVEANAFELPPAYLLKRAGEFAAAMMKQNGLDLDRLPDAYRAQSARMFMPTAEKLLKQDLLSRYVAEREKIEPTADDLRAELERRAEESRQPLARVLAQYAAPERRAALASELTVQQALRLVVARAHVTDVDALTAESTADGVADAIDTSADAAAPAES